MKINMARTKTVKGRWSGKINDHSAFTKEEKGRGEDHEVAGGGTTETEGEDHEATWEGTMETEGEDHEAAGGGAKETEGEDQEVEVGPMETEGDQQVMVVVVTEKIKEKEQWE